MNINTLKSALISEKSFKLASNGKFSFLVDTKSNKGEVALVCKELFGVDVVSVNIVNIPGKVKRSKTGMGRRSDIKKAIVTLKPGQKIALFELEEKAEKKNSKEKSKEKK